MLFSGRWSGLGTRISLGKKSLQQVSILAVTGPLERGLFCFSTVERFTRMLQSFRKSIFTLSSPGHIAVPRNTNTIFVISISCDHLVSIIFVQVLDL
eukprot:g631.t1